MLNWLLRRVTSLSTAVYCLLAVTSVVDPQTVVNGPLSDGSECCGHQLADSSGRRVVIETSRTLSPNTYPYLRIRACTVDPVAVQLWRRMDDVTYEFRWQYVLSPTPAQTTRSYITITLPSAVSVTSSDRIGVYASSGNELTVPFDPSPPSRIFYSLNVINNSTFVVGQRIELDDMSWPRTLSQRLAFCLSQDCPDFAPDVPGSSTPTTNQCCQPETGMSCDPGPSVTNGLATQSQYIRQLQQNVDRLNRILSTMVSHNYVTGLCPQGFLSGSYGVGSCYILFQTASTMAEAVIACRSYSAYLLTIETDVEDLFIKNFVQNNTVSAGQSSVTKFWTTAMYDRAHNAWFWYSGTSGTMTSSSGSPPNRFDYSNWLNSTVPVPSGSDDICMTAAVDRTKNTVYWTKEYCATKYYFICELPKQCL